MKRKFADFPAALLDFALDVDGVAFAEGAHDLAAQRLITGDAEHPSDAHGFVGMGKHCGDGERQFIGCAWNDAADRAGQ